MIKFNLKLFIMPVPVSIVGKNSFFLTMSISMYAFVAHVQRVFFLAKFYLFSHCYHNPFGQDLMPLSVFSSLNIIYDDTSI